MARLLKQHESVDDIWLFPTWFDGNTRSLVSSDYTDIRISRQLPKKSTFVITPDTPQESDLKLLRETKAQIIWWNLAVPGAFTNFGLGCIRREPLEIEYVYSSLISTEFPQLFIQPKLKLLENIFKTVSLPTISGKILEKDTKNLKLIKKNLKDKKLNIACYQGKGCAKILSPKLRKLFKNCDVQFIDRYSPATKGRLYQVLLGVDLLLSFDPFSNINIEANMLGVPVFCPGGLPSLDLVREYPLNMSGIAFSDNEFISILQNGFNSELSRSDYWFRRRENKQVALRLIKDMKETQIIRKKNKKQKTHFSPIMNESINIYWHAKANTWMGYFKNEGRIEMKYFRGVKYNILRHFWSKFIRIFQIPGNIRRNTIQSIKNKFEAFVRYILL